MHRPLNGEERKLIALINKSFGREDIYVESMDNKIIFHFRSLDLDKFRKLTGGRDPFSSVIAELESIKSYGIKSGKRVYVGYNKERKVKNRKDKAKERNVYFYASHNSFSKVNVEVPNEFENRIICGDSEEILKKLPDNCIDLVFTSPPYNFGLDYENHEDGTNWEDYFNKLFKIFDE
ncbi:MAG: hypothetical protein QXP70_00215, partial [Methanomassiliicoccales archaeon]